MAETKDFKFVEEYFDFVEQTDKTKEYYINKKYSQYQVDEMLSKINYKQ